MYEIDLSTIMLIGINDSTTKIITINDEFIVNISAKKIIGESCRFFGSSLTDRIKATNRLVIEESRNIIFFPLKSTREKNNIWVSFNNLEKYEKKGNSTIFYFKSGKKEIIEFSYYIVDNQVTRSILLDYEINKRRKSLEK